MKITFLCFSATVTSTEQTNPLFLFIYFFVSSDLHFYSRCVFYVCDQVRDGAMSDLQTQLREVLRENELLRREVRRLGSLTVLVECCSRNLLSIHNLTLFPSNT